MSKIKIAFFDIDGTLIDPEKKRITDNTKKALLKLKENGVKICIATGRPPEKVPDFKSEGIDFDAFLTFNGSYSFNETETIFEINEASLAPYGYRGDTRENCYEILRCCRKYHLPRCTINCRLSDCLFQAFFRDTPDADSSI